MQQWRRVGIQLRMATAGTHVLAIEVRVRGWMSEALPVHTESLYSFHSSGMSCNCASASNSAFRNVSWICAKCIKKSLPSKALSSGGILVNGVH